MIYIVDAEEEHSENEEEESDNAQLKISMHAAHGQPEDKPTHTFSLLVQLGSTTALALVDSGSTTTFLSPEIAQKSRSVISPVKQVNVTVANGGQTCQ